MLAWEVVVAIGFWFGKDFTSLFVSRTHDLRLACRSTGTSVSVHTGMVHNKCTTLPPLHRDAQ
jgi:hypothetical protein